MDFVGAKILGLLLTPPGVILLAALTGLLVRLRWAWIGNTLVGASLIVFFALSLPMMGHALIVPLETRYHALPALTPEEAKKQAGAIVVLAGGRYTAAPEYEGSDVTNDSTLDRLRYAAYLQRRTGLPILVTGGSPFGEESAEALLMQEALESDFQIRPKWVETRARNTQENAAFTKEILAGAGIRRIYLVTHAWHMPRAEWAFVNAGLDVVPAPMSFTTLGKAERELFGYLPSAHGLSLSNLALRERLGLVWYRYKYSSEPATETKKPAAAS